METITITREDFAKLLGSLKLIETSCTDCDIVGGLIRQTTNDRHAIFEIDLSKILKIDGSDSEKLADISLSLIKQKNQILKTFELDDNVQIDDKNIILNIEDTKYEILDSLSKVTLRKPVKKFLDNTFIEDENFNSIMSNCTEENLMLSCDISPYMTKRIKNICEAFAIDVIQCKLEGRTACLSIISDDKDNTTKVVGNITLNNEVSSSYFSFISLPFTIELNSSMAFKAYKIGDDVIMCKFSQKYYDVTVDINSKVKITSD